MAYIFHVLLYIIALYAYTSLAVVNLETATLSWPRSGLSAIEAGSKVYFIGGFEHGDVRATKTIEVYDLIAQNMSSPLQLDTPRAFITPVVIEPNIYLIGGLDNSNRPFVYDPLPSQFVSYETGPTVATPIRFTIHNSYLTVIGASGVDVFDLQLAEWKDTAPLKTMLSELALVTLFSHEEVVLVIGGVNVNTNVTSQSTWAYNITTGEVHEYPDMFSTSIALSNILVEGADGVVKINSGSTLILLHLQRRVWKEFNFPAFSRVLSSPDQTFLFNSSIVAAFDWNTNDTMYEPIADFRHAFMVNGTAVYLILNASASNTVFRVYDPVARAWNTTYTLLTTFMNVSMSVTLKSGWHVFKTTATNVVYGYNAALNVLQQVTDGGLVFFSTVTALIPAEETDQVFIFENGRLTKTQFTAHGVVNVIKQQQCATNFVPVARFGLDLLDQKGRVVNLINPTAIGLSNVQLKEPLLAFSDKYFAMTESSATPVPYNYVDIYNYVTNERNSTAMPAELTTNAGQWFYSAAALDGKLVVWMDSVISVYDPSTGNWTSYTNYTQSPVNNIKTNVHIPIPTAQGKAFMRTGNNTLDIFSTDSLPLWNSTSPSLTVEGGAQYNFTQCLVYNNSKLFITSRVAKNLIGVVFNTLYIYDVLQDSWEYIQLSNAVKSLPVITLAGDYLLSMNNGVLSYWNIITQKLDDEKVLGFTFSPAVVLESKANVTFIAGGVNQFGTYSNRMLIIPHGAVLSSEPVVTPNDPIVSPTSPVESGLSEGELIAAIVVPIAVALIATALLVFFLVRRQKRRRRRGGSSTMTGLESKYGQWFIPFNSIKFGDQLGQGASGQVFKGTWNSTSVALKVSMTQANLTVIGELELMIQLRPHPNVIQLLGFSVHPETDSIILVIEFCNGGSLDDTLFDAQQTIPMEQKISWLLGMAKGIEHLHANNIVHRDIAARNVLLHQNEPKITDFGMSRLIDEDKQRGTTKSELGPIRWMSPESLKNKEYSNKSDVWSFGILMFEVIAQSEPHIDADPIEVGRLIRDNGLTPTIPSSCASDLAELMKECWHMSPDKRISIDQIVLRLEAMQQ